MHVPSVVSELGSVKLGDFRCEQRLRKAITALQAHPDTPYPEVFDDAGLEGFYRLMASDKVTMAEVIRPHLARTAERAVAAGEYLVVHDTTEICHGRGSKGKDYYDLQNGLFGYLAHVALVLDANGLVPLGIAHLAIVNRNPERAPRINQKTTWHADDKESLRWWEGVEAVEAICPGGIHVIDREGDSFELLYKMVHGQRRFVVRGRVNRRVRSSAVYLKNELESAGVRLTRSVPVSSRGRPRGRDKSSHPARESRVAQLEVAAKTVELKRPKNLPGSGPKALPTRLSIRVVHVREVGLVKGEAPIEWILYTSEPIETAEDLARVVDIYSARWVIEELFKSLKTGCAFESRQFESQKTSQTALAMTLPIAWRLLLLRQMERVQPDAPAKVVLDANRIRILRRIGRRKLPPRPTVRDVLLAVAALGGHLKSNGPPGWLVIGRGMRHLDEAVSLLEILQAPSQSDADLGEM